MVLFVLKDIMTYNPNFESTVGYKIDVELLDSIEVNLILLQKFADYYDLCKNFT
jgi:hypothetical protein